MLRRNIGDLLRAAANKIDAPTMRKQIDARIVAELVRPKRP